MTHITGKLARAAGADVHNRPLTEDESAWFLAVLCSPADEVDELLRDNYPNSLNKVS
jgi:hypothetical protein